MLFENTVYTPVFIFRSVHMVCFVLPKAAVVFCCCNELWTMYVCMYPLIYQMSFYNVDFSCTAKRNRTDREAAVNKWKGVLEQPFLCCTRPDILPKTIGWLHYEVLYASLFLSVSPLSVYVHFDLPSHPFTLLALYAWLCCSLFPPSHVHSHTLSLLSHTLSLSLCVML